jgi:hypothetical protein
MGCRTIPCCVDFDFLLFLSQLFFHDILKLVKLKQWGREDCPVQR